MVESSTVHGSSATSSGTAAVRAAPLLSSSTVRRGAANRSLMSDSSAETSSRSRCSESRIAVSLGDLALQGLPRRAPSSSRS